MSRVMITDGNNVHAADYHAEVTAEKIVTVAETASDETVTASRDLRKKVEKILTVHHTAVGEAEQVALAEHGAARYGHDLDATEHVTDEMVAEIVAASNGTVLQAHFARPDVQEVIREILHHESRSQMNVHREVHRAAAVIAAKPRLVS